MIRGCAAGTAAGSVVAEARDLVGEGVREINLISQDTTYFGMDLWGGAGRPDAACARSALSDLGATRNRGQVLGPAALHHSAHWSDELIRTIADCDKVARYVVLCPSSTSTRKCSRGCAGDFAQAHRGFDWPPARGGCPGLALRTTFHQWVFRGGHFESLLDFIAAMRFEPLGVFTYSREESSRTARMPGHFPAMRLQQRIARRWPSVGKTLDVLVEKDGRRAEAERPEVAAELLAGAAEVRLPRAHRVHFDWRAAGS